jgi:hypothetical protein
MLAPAPLVERSQGRTPGEPAADRLRPEASSCERAPAGRPRRSPGRAIHQRRTLCSQRSRPGGAESGGSAFTVRELLASDR